MIMAERGRKQGCRREGGYKALPARLHFLPSAHACASALPTMLSAQILVLLLPVLALRAAAHTGEGAAVSQAQVYWSREPGNGTAAAQAVLPPNTAIHGPPLGPALTAVAQPEACSSACRSTANCSWFEFCGAQVGNSNMTRTSRELGPVGRPAAPSPPPQGGCAEAGSGPLAFQECRLLATQCGKQPVVHATGWPVQVVSGAHCALALRMQSLFAPFAPARLFARISPAQLSLMLIHPCTCAGFPARTAPQAIGGFSESAGWGIVAADLNCPGSLVANKCALASTLDAATLCVEFLGCRALTIFLNGAVLGCHSPALCFSTPLVPCLLHAPKALPLLCRHRRLLFAAVVS